MVDIFKIFRNANKIPGSELYIVTNDNVHYGVSRGVHHEDLIIDMLYDSIVYYRADRFLAHKDGKYGFLTADIYGEKEKYTWSRCADVVIPFIFDEVTPKEDDTFIVSIGNTSGVMDLDGNLLCHDVNMLLNNVSQYRGDDYYYIPTIINENKVNLLYCWETTNDFHIIGRGIVTESGNDNSNFDSFRLMALGVMNKEGKCIIPMLFREITPLYDSNGKLAYFVARRNCYDYIAKVGCELGNPDYIQEYDHGDSFLFSKDGECMLGEFTDIELLKDGTLKVILKGYVEENTFKRVDDYNLCLLLDADFHVNGLPHAIGSYRHSWLKYDIQWEQLNVEPKIESQLIERLGLKVTIVPLCVVSYNDNVE